MTLLAARPTCTLWTSGVFVCYADSFEKASEGIESRILSFMVPGTPVVNRCVSSQGLGLHDGEGRTSSAGMSLRRHLQLAVFNGA